MLEGAEKGNSKKFKTTNLKLAEEPSTQAGQEGPAGDARATAEVSGDTDAAWVSAADVFA